MSDTPAPYIAPLHAANDEPPSIRDLISDAYPDDDLLFFDPPSLDKAIVGVATRINFGPVLVYDRAKLVQAFVDDGMSQEDADEWVSVNVEGAYVGENTPLISTSVDVLTS